MRNRYLSALAIIGTAAAVAACDNDPPAEEVLEQAEETLEEAPDVVPVPVPVPVDTTALDTTGLMQPADTTL